MATKIRQLEGVSGRREYFQVDPRRIVVRPTFNPRTDMGDMDSLTASIVANGILTPLRVWRGPANEFFLTDGHRRLAAVMLAIDQGHEIRTVPCLFGRSDMSESEELFEVLAANDGKPLTPSEEAEVFRRFLAWGFTMADVARRIGRSAEFVRQRLRLIDAAPAVRAAVDAGEIGVSRGLEIVRQSNGDLSTQSEALSQSRPKHKHRQPRRRPADVVLDRMRQMELPDLVALASSLAALIAEREVENAR